MPHGSDPADTGTFAGSTMFVLLTIACAVPESLTATTDGGTWTVSITDAPEGRGITDLAATVTPAPVP